LYSGVFRTLSRSLSIPALVPGDPALLLLLLFLVGRLPPLEPRHHRLDDLDLIQEDRQGLLVVLVLEGLPQLAPEAVVLLPLLGLEGRRDLLRVAAGLRESGSCEDDEDEGNEDESHHRAPGSGEIPVRLSILYGLRTATDGETGRRPLTDIRTSSSLRG